MAAGSAGMSSRATRTSTYVMSLPYRSCVAAHRAERHNTSACQASHLEKGVRTYGPTPRLLRGEPVAALRYYVNRLGYEILVVGVDESDGAADALRWAVREADVHDAKVTAVMAWGFLDQHHTIVAERFDPSYADDDALEAAQQPMSWPRTRRCVAVTCRVLNLARQPYYRWLKCPVSDAEWEQAHLANALFDARTDLQPSTPSNSPRSIYSDRARYHHDPRDGTSRLTQPVTRSCSSPQRFERNLIMTRTTTRLVVAALAIGALTLAACGDDDTTAGTEASPRTVEIDMRDIEFSPDEVDVEAGETVRFVFHNRGDVTHDAFIGDEAAQDDHEMEMRGEGEMSEMSDMGDEGGEGHDAMDDENGITVMPGETGEITHTFTEGDDLLIGCHEAGHYDAGMRIMINMS